MIPPAPGTASYVVCCVGGAEKGNHMELLFMVTAILTLTLIAAFAIRRAEEK